MMPFVKLKRFMDPRVKPEGDPRMCGRVSS
jgi:hypothetical protein